MVNFLLAVESCVSHRALTEVTTFRVVSAAPIIEARPICAGIGTQLTVVAIETRWAGADIAVIIVSAAASVPTRVSRTFVDLDLTAGTCVSRQTGASVAALVSIGTGGSIETGLMVCTVVQILVAEEPTPSLLAVTLPGLLAGAMEAAWVTDTVITVTPTEANATLALSRFITEAMFFITARKTDWFSAVLSLPARVADDLPTLAAGKVAESIIPGPAEDGAAITVVVLITQEAVGVSQLSSPGCLHILEPLFSHGEVTLGGDPADQTLRVVCCQVVQGVSVQGFNDQ